ncbi:hypothetical protein [Nostoc sp.]
MLLLAALPPAREAEPLETGFHVKLTRISNTVPLQYGLFTIAG